MFTGSVWKRFCLIFHSYVSEPLLYKSVAYLPFASFKTYRNFSEWALAAKEVPKEVYLFGGHTVLCLCPRHAMPGKLHTIHGHPPMRRLNSNACRTNCIPSTLTDQWEDRTHMPCQTSCILSTSTNQWEDWTRMPCRTSCHTIYFHRPMRKLGFLCLCHAGPTAYHLLSPTNEKTGHVHLPHTGPAAINSSVTTHRYENKAVIVCCAQPTACYLSQPMRRHTVPPTTSTNETQVKSTKPYGKKCVKDTELC